MSDNLQEKCVLITGATGFIGQRLFAALRSRPGIMVRALVRDTAQAGRIWPLGGPTNCVADLAKPDSLIDVCNGVDTVFHLAGYAHANDTQDDDAADQHHRITVLGTQALLASAAKNGVKRFIFVSSIKAMGEGSDLCEDESSITAPESSYGRAKLAAERLVLNAGSNIQVCVLRLPMVYGHDNKGNLPRMIAAIDHGRFPPLPELGNKRSMVHVDDVVQALMLVAEKPAASGQTYIVTDEHSYSTRYIYTLICAALGRPVPRWVMPVKLLKLAARLGDLIGAVRGRPFIINSKALDKLLGSAWYSSSKIRRELGYRPTRSLENALPEMVAEYRNSLSSERLGSRSVLR